MSFASLPFDSQLLVGFLMFLLQVIMFLNLIFISFSFTVYYLIESVLLLFFSLVLSPKSPTIITKSNLFRKPFTPYHTHAYTTTLNPALPLLAPIRPPTPFLTSLESLCTNINVLVMRLFFGSPRILHFRTRNPEVDVCNNQFQQLQRHSFTIFTKHSCGVSYHSWLTSPTTHAHLYPCSLLGFYFYPSIHSSNYPSIHPSSHSFRHILLFLIYT
ncbi:hypothetical protein BJ165DRAFT_281415 [Panaeolus papilionaceus]|nr:hypothetical protein BJ165DRAFT_281415 [Panaeolus papilionaceus]